MRRDSGHTAADLPADGQRGLGTVLLFAAVAPLITLLVLQQLGIPLGCPGRLVYLYSPLPALRLLHAVPAVLIGFVLMLGTWLAAGTGWRRRTGLLTTIVGSIALGLWSYVAPPYYRTQHMFNTHSPSHDGAFVTEALGVTSVCDYLRGFPQRARTPPDEMRGTRVISNPPGTTLLAVAVDRLVRRFPVVGELALGPWPADIPADSPHQRVRYAATCGLVFFWTLTGLWLLAGVFLYWTARLFLSTPVAVVYSLCCVFSPMTLLFTPGKDPAQLLTVAVPLYLWMRAARSGASAWAVGAGLVFIVSCGISLVHIWIAAVVVVATLLASSESVASLRRIAVRLLLPAVGAAVLGTFLLRALVGLDLLAATRAVAGTQAEVTRGPGAMPLVWQLLGLPLFLLFAGPAWWTMALWAAVPARRGPTPLPAARLGRYLLLLSAAVLLATVGFTNLETPRLWIPFVPLLLLGVLLPLGWLSGSSRGAVRLLVLLVGVQVAISALQWSRMDMRETETRLVEQRFFDSRSPTAFEPPKPHSRGERRGR